MTTGSGVNLLVGLTGTQESALLHLSEFQSLNLISRRVCGVDAFCWTFSAMDLNSRPKWIGQGLFKIILLSNSVSNNWSTAVTSLMSHGGAEIHRNVLYCNPSACWKVVTCNVTLWTTREELGKEKTKQKETEYGYLMSVTLLRSNPNTHRWCCCSLSCCKCKR